MSKPFFALLVAFGWSLMCCGLSLTCCAQSQSISVPSYIRIPLDSVQKDKLVTALNGLLGQLPGPDKDNRFVDPSFIPETADLLDEMRGMDKSGTDRFRCYLTNVCGIDSTDYFVQLAYLRTVDSTPILRASFTLIAHRVGEGFRFSSPLRRNTATWHVRKTGYFYFYYSDYPFNESQIAEYIEKAGEFDRKLGVPPYLTKFYCCETLQEALEVLGVDYKLDYSGVGSESLTAFGPGVSLHVIGGTDTTIFDLHDLWHDRLHAATPATTIINRPIDEGCAYLYGGSWGISWEKIFRQFVTFMGDNKDWLAAFNENKNFALPNQNHLYVDYVINALLAKKIEKEKGFRSVLEWLACGKYEKGNDNYFQALDRVIGINRTNFNANVEELVAAEK
jgi:hypothetical protein